jgi:hypothetical protein
MTAGRPGAVARAAVALAVGALRTPEDRERYRAEFLAELADLRPGQRLRHCAGVLATILALRAALGGSPSHVTEDAMTLSIPPVRPWRCRVLRWHSWVVRSTEDGGLYQLCAHCGRELGPVGYGPMTTPPYRDPWSSF